MRGSGDYPCLEAEQTLGEKTLTTFVRVCVCPEPASLLCVYEETWSKPCVYLSCVPTKIPYNTS